MTPPDAVTRSAHRRRAWVVLLAALTALWVVVILPADHVSAAQNLPVATKAKLSQQVIETSVAHVRTTTGRRLLLRLTAYRIPNATEDDGFQVSLANSEEQHTWGLPAKRRAFAVDREGTGTVETGDVAPFGDLSLKVTDDGPGTAGSCANPNPTRTETYPATITGHMSFDTLSSGRHRWGSLHHARLRFPHSTVLDYFGDSYCFPPPATAPCTPAGVRYQSIYLSGPRVSIEGEQLPGGRARIHLMRTVSLAKPAHSTRQDEVLGTTGQLAIHRQANGGATLAVRGNSSNVSGSVTFAQDSKPDSDQCPADPSHLETEWNFATLTARHLAGHAMIFGNLHVTSRHHPETFANMSFESDT